MPPLIGITTSQFVMPETGWLYNRAYVPIIHSVTEAGGLPILIPISVTDNVLYGIYQHLDGILLPGGGDIRPSVYGALVHPSTANMDDARDHTEIQLAQWAVSDDLPLMGICRGHQVMNVAFGGTLIQDIPSEIQTTLTHDISDGMSRSTLLHEVDLDPSSHLTGILGGTRWKVNSLHHQSVEKPAALPLRDGSRAGWGGRRAGNAGQEIYPQCPMASRRFVRQRPGHAALVQSLYRGSG